MRWLWYGNVPGLVVVGLGKVFGLHVFLFMTFANLSRTYIVNIKRKLAKYLTSIK